MDTNFISSKNDNDIVIGISEILDENTAPGSLANVNNLRIFIKVNQIRKVSLSFELDILKFLLLTQNSLIKKRRDL